MANIVISGNTYQDINYIHFKGEKGEQVTFVPEERRNNMQTGVSISALSGRAWSLICSPILKTPKATMIKEV